MAKGRVTFDYDSCKGCGLCVTACPKEILFLDTSRINVKGYHPSSCKDQDACIGCANCAMICPDLIITVERL